MASHRTGATTRIGEILGQAFDRRAGDAGGIERRSIAADDMRYCDACRAEFLAFERDRRHPPRADAGCVARSSVLAPRATIKIPNGNRNNSRSMTRAIKPTMTMTIRSAATPRQLPASSRLPCRD